MQRITEKMLQARIDYLNKITGNPATPYTDRKANIGNYHLSSAYGGVNLNQMHNDGGGVTCPLGSYHRPKRELMLALDAFIAGFETLEKIKLDRPEIAISMKWEVDEYYTWDGDGPDPENDGFLPYDVTVTASTIRKGEMIQGRDVIGGCYSRDGGKDNPEISGYLSQMIEAAVEELDSQLN